MNSAALTNYLFRNSILFFAVFCFLVLWGFWSTFYSNPLQLSSLLIHLHGSAMTLWCLMLLGQAYLIRTNRRDLHRFIGRISYVLAALNVALQISVLRNRVPAHAELFDQGVISAQGLVFLSLGIGNACVFALLYGLAINYRRKPALHARFIVCTTLPILPAATDRILDNYFPNALQNIPKVAGEPYGPLAAWGAADLTLVAFAVWDWRSRQRPNVFPFVLLILLAHQIFTVNAHRVPAWKTFCQWFLG
jgi:hypothetical protein